MTRTVLGTLSFGLAAILAASTLPSDSSTAAQAPGPIPVATIGQLERAMVGPSSDAIFNVGRAEPATDDEWLALEDAAVILTEAPNLYMMDGRRADDGEWITMARAMYEAGRAALVAVEARDVDGILGLSTWRLRKQRLALLEKATSSASSSGARSAFVQYQPALMAGAQAVVVEGFLNRDGRHPAALRRQHRLEPVAAIGRML